MAEILALEEPTQNWRTFLRNHLGEVGAMDFLTVPTVTFQTLYVFVVLSLDRRRILHFNERHPKRVTRRIDRERTGSLSAYLGWSASPVFPERGLNFACFANSSSPAPVCPVTTISANWRKAIQTLNSGVPAGGKYYVKLTLSFGRGPAGSKV